MATWGRLSDRRESLRVLTVKNVAWLLTAMLAIFVIVSTYNELRPQNASRPRLYERGSAPEVPTRKPVDVIEAQPVSDDTFAVRNDGWRQFPPTRATPPPPAPLAAAEPARVPTLKETQKRGGKTVITGGADGVRVKVQ